jgi:hypothetical protein
MSQGAISIPQCSNEDDVFETTSFVGLTVAPLVPDHSSYSTTNCFSTETSSSTPLSHAVAVVVTQAGQTAAAEAETAKAPSPQDETTQPIAREFIAEDALLEHWQA